MGFKGISKMKTKDWVELYQVVVWIAIIWALMLLLCGFVEGAEHTHYVNMSIDNNSVKIETPHQVYETTCGQQLDKQFGITHSYDEEIYYYYNYTYSYNTTITKECEYEDNYTIRYNITYCENETNMSDIDRLVNATFRKCADAKSVCYDLYHGETNVSYIVNISGEDIRDDVNETMVEFRDYITTTLFTYEQKCQAWEDNYKRCNDQWLADCKRDQNITAIELASVKNRELFYTIIIVVALLGWVVMLGAAIGKGAIFGRLGLKSKGDIKR